MKLEISHFLSKPFHEEQSCNQYLCCLIHDLKVPNLFLTPEFNAYSVEKALIHALEPLPKL